MTSFPLYTQQCPLITVTRQYSILPMYLRSILHCISDIQWTACHTS